MRSTRLVLIVTGLAALLGSLVACDPWATRTWTVQVATDGVDAAPGDGVCEANIGAADCTLRAALDEANATPERDLVRIAPGVDPTPGGQLTITAPLDLEGQGATIHDRIAHTAGDLTIRDLTISGVVSVDVCGGAIESTGTLLSLVRSTVTGNENQGPAHVATGGGICATGPLALTESVVSDNSVTSDAAATGGGIHATGKVTVVGSTISGNDLPAFPGSAGAGLHITGGGELTVVDSTVTGNGTGSSGGASALHAPGVTGTIVASTIDGGTGAAPTIVANAGVGVSGSIIAATGPATACSAAPAERPATNGFNLVTDTSCGFASASDLVATDPQLEPLADNGGPTPTRTLPESSPAIDAVPPGTAGLCDGTVALDQRSHARPTGLGCEIGAVEVFARIFVDTAADGADTNPGDGLCTVAATGCSIRAAIDEANAQGGAVIEILAGTDPVLTIAGAAEDTNATGDLDVHGALTIIGNGAVIDAAGLDRVLDVHSGPALVRDLTFTGGNLAGIISIGAGINTRADLTVENVVVTDNITTGSGAPQSGLGGGIGSSNVTVTVRDSTISSNTTTGAGGGGGGGGGIYALGGNLVIERSRITDNHTDGPGGGIEYSNAATISDTVIDHNTASVGGGVVAGNNTTSTYDRVTVDSNTATGDGGGLWLSGVPAIVTMTNSTVSNNTSNGWGGGFFTIGDLSLTNVTVSGNAAANGGAAIFDSFAQVTVVASTITANSGFSAIASSGALLPPVVRGSIVIGGAVTCDAAVTSGGGNVTSDGSCGLTDPTDIQAATIGLGALADNGGPTLTHLPDPTSPAVDAIAPATAGLCDGSNPTDQRGSARPSGPACDAGSVER